MTRLFHVSGDHDLAKRTLRLYVQVVKKQRETGTVNENGEDMGDSGACESDKNWVDTLVHGARMLCRLPGTVEDIREAIRLVLQARERSGNVDDRTLAEIDLADGICESMLALRGTYLDL